MATNAKYKIYDASLNNNQGGWVEYHFATNAGQVTTTYDSATGKGRKFVTPSITINGNTAGTTGAKVTVGSDDAANIEIDGAHITGKAAAYSSEITYSNVGTANALHIVAASDAVSTALGKLDKAVYKALTTIPTNVVTTDNNGDIDLSGHNVYAETFGHYLAGTNFQGLQFYDGDTSLITGNGDLYLNTGTGKAYYGSSEIASQSWVNSKLGTAAAKDYTTSVTQNGTGLVTAGAVWAAIDALPEPMVFKGSLGTGGTITSLTTAAADKEGYTYKVITAGKYASKDAKVGDTFICAKTGTSTYEWVLIPSGDEPSGTVTSVGLSVPTDIFSVSGSPVTSSGTLKFEKKNQNKNLVFAGPSTGNAAAPTFRALVKADLPSLTLDDISDGSTRKLANYVPYTGATKDVNIGDHTLRANCFLSQGENMNPNSGITFYEGDTTLNSDASLNLQGSDVYLNANGEGGKAYYNNQEIATKEWTHSNFSRVFVKSGSTAPTAPTGGFHSGDIWIN